VDELLLEAFRHNAWATRRLLSFCRDLTADQLDATATGTFGSIVATFNHVIYADANYLPRPKMTRPAWASDEDNVVSDLAELERRVDETAGLWEKYLANPLDARQLLSLDQGAYEAESFVPIAQALHHGNVHREQICSILTALGIEPPDLQVWAYAEATGHAREVPAADKSPAG
jgi:uncharacterized damage-inducible protein DinB